MGVRLRWHRAAWWLFISHGNIRRSKRLGTDRAAALRAKVDLEERLNRTDLGLPLRDRQTVQQYADAWIDRASLKASTKRFYRDHLENHIYPAIGRLPIGAVTRLHVRDLVSRTQAKKLRPKTIQGILRTLSTVLSEAVEDERLPANPALRPGRMRRAMTDPNAPKQLDADPYTREEAAALVTAAAVAYPEWAAFTLCALRAGLRLGELRALEWDDLDWRGRYMLVSRNYVEGVATTPKSGRSRRVDLSDQLIAGLRLHRRQQGAYWLSEGKERPRLVFPSRAGTPLDDSKVRKAMRSIALAAKVRPRTRIVHVLRHTYCSLLIAAGASIEYVKEQAGHSSITVTAGYLKYMPASGRATVNKLDDEGMQHSALIGTTRHAKAKRNAQ